MSAALNHRQLDRALKGFASAQEAVYTQLAYVVEAEMALLARRFPTRRLQFDSGMGSSSIFISRRAGSPHADYLVSDSIHDITDWACRNLAIGEAIWKAIQLVEDSTDGKDPGLGTIIYENGKRLKGITA